MKRKMLIKLTALILTASALTFMLPGTVLKTNALVTEADIKTIEDKIASNESKIDQYEANIAALKKSTASVMQLKSELDAQIKTMQDNIDDTALLIGEYERMILQKSELIDECEAELEKRYSVLSEYLRTAHEDGILNPLELLLSSESLTDFLVRYERMTNLVESHKTMMDTINSEIEELNAIKADLAEKKKITEELKAKQINAEAELQSKLQEANSLLLKYQTDSATMQKALSEAQALEDALNAEIQKKLEELEAQKNAYVGGKFIWPVDIQYSYLSSYFGMRDMDGDGVREQFHGGIDIPANYGSNVYAVNGGTVVTATYHSSYGYYVLIDHGGGIATLYAHNSKLCVTAGQTVKQGDIIAKIGSTGDSTGCHCHFEVRVNGVRVDPLGEGYVVKP